MSLLEKFKKIMQKDVVSIHISEKEDLFSIPYDYDGYDFLFEVGKTDPKLYEEINDIVTNGKFNIREIKNYEVLKMNSDNDLFFEFYDEWLAYLRENKYVIHLDNRLGIKEFAERINELLRQIGSDDQIDCEFVVNRYREELKCYSINDVDICEEINYDVLEANIIAQELRKIGYELINFLMDLIMMIRQ